MSDELKLSTRQEGMLHYIHDSIEDVQQKLGIPVEIVEVKPASLELWRDFTGTVEGVRQALALDKKAVVSGLRLVLLNAIGNALIDSQSSQHDILSALEQSVSPEWISPE